MKQACLFDGMTCTNGFYEFINSKKSQFLSRNGYLGGEEFVKLVGKFILWYATGFSEELTWLYAF